MYLPRVIPGLTNLCTCWFITADKDESGHLETCPCYAEWHGRNNPADAGEYIPEVNRAADIPGENPDPDPVAAHVGASWGVPSVPYFPPTPDTIHTGAVMEPGQDALEIVPEAPKEGTPQ